MIIRYYRETDILRIIELYNDTTKEFNWGDLNNEQKKIILFKNISLANQLLISNFTLVLEKDNRIIGFVMMRKDGYINFLYVDKKEINKGYGRKLILSIEKIARKIGLNKVFLYSSKFTSKNNIYEKLGYTNLGNKNYFIKDVLFEGYKMEKKIK